MQVQQYKDDLISKAETLITVGFPEKIVQLNELLETPMFVKRNLQDIHQPLNIPIPEPIELNHVNNDADGAQPAKRPRNESNSEPSGTKVYALPMGKVACNAVICDVIKVVKPIIRALVEDTNLLKMWISFMIPKVRTFCHICTSKLSFFSPKLIFYQNLVILSRSKQIEDGNNFGVSIQEDTLAEIQSVESEAAAFIDQISRYFISRAKIVSKVAKYPHIEDYRRAVQVNAILAARHRQSTTDKIILLTAVRCLLCPANRNTTRRRS